MKAKGAKMTPWSDKLKEACGVYAVALNEPEAAGLTYNGLLALQHRGQEGAGIAVLDGSALISVKDIGLASEVFACGRLDELPPSYMGLGHVRYSTTGSNSRANVQPIVKEYIKGRIALAHNGNIINGAQIKARLIQHGCDFQASSDSEIIATLIAYEALRCQTIEEAVTKAAQRIQGAFSMVVLSNQRKLIALRDPHGFRPLCLGKNEHGFAVASESCALDGTGFQWVRDVMPGEMIVIEEGRIKPSMALEPSKEGLCLFEMVYFARPDSVIDGLSVQEARFQAGKILAREHPADADVVCGVPDSGIEAAQGYASQSGLPCVSGFVKNRYIGRSFIYPSQVQREAAVKLKLNPLKRNVQGKRIVLVDDSIVRGTTSARIIQSLKEAGASQVHMRVSSPPFRHSCSFGTDIDDPAHLIANQLNMKEIAQKIGADSLGFISVAGLVHACQGCQLNFCTGCFNGQYPLQTPSLGKNQFESE